MGRASRAKAERREQTDRRLHQIEQGTRRCLICSSTGGIFRSAEHPVPESLGGVSVLPKGVVCDRCNNERLAVLDQAALKLAPFAAQRVFKGIPSKSTGKVPDVRLQGGVLRSTGPNAIALDMDGTTEMMRELGHTDGRIHFNLSMKGGPRMTPRYVALLSSWLLKIALATAWFQHGDAVLQSRFDNVRDSISDGPRDGYVAFARRGTPSPSITTQHWIGEDSNIAVIADVYGMTFATDSVNPEPVIAPPPDDITVIKFQRSDFRGYRAS